MVMQKFKIVALSIAAAICVLASEPALASVTYSYVAEKSSYQAAAGSSVSVNIYLREALTAGSTSFLASDGGLSAFSVALLKSGSPSTPATITGLAANSADFPQFSSTPQYTMFTASGGTATGAIPLGGAGILVGNTGNGAAPAIAQEVYLGTATIQVGSSGSTTFTLGAVDPVNGGNTVTKNNVFDLDNQTDGGGAPTNAYVGVGTTLTSFTVSPTAIPEPASLGLLCLGGLLALRRHRA